MCFVSPQRRHLFCHFCCRLDTHAAQSLAQRTRRPNFHAASKKSVSEEPKLRRREMVWLRENQSLMRFESGLSCRRRIISAPTRNPKHKKKFLRCNTFSNPAVKTRAALRARGRNRRGVFQGDKKTLGADVQGASRGAVNSRLISTRFLK